MNRLRGKYFYDVFNKVQEANSAIREAFQICPKDDPVYWGSLNHIRHELTSICAEMRKESHIIRIWSELNGDINRAFDSEDRDAAIASAMGSLNVTTFQELNEVFERYCLENFTEEDND